MQIPDPTGIAYSEHYITGNCQGVDDTSLEGLGRLYGVSWSDIADLNFGGHSVKQIYDWLSTHGGRKQTPFSGHVSGWHWSFAPGMIASVPGPVSKSPVPGTGGVQIGDPNAPETSLPPPPSTPDVGSTPGDVGMGPPEGGGGGGFAPAAAGGAFTWILIAGAAIGIFMMLKGGKGGKGKHSGKKSARKRSRRR